MKFTTDQGFCTTLCYVVFMDGGSKIGDAMLIQNVAFDARHLFADPVDGSFAARSVLLLFGQRTSDWGRAANPEFTR